MIRKQTVWLLFTVLTATACGQSKDVTYTTHLDGVVKGFDPFCVNSFIQPDPGIRSPIFQPLRNPIHSTEDEVIVNPFINEAEAPKCFPDLTIQTVTNYPEFHKYFASSTYQISSAVNYASRAVGYGDSGQCETMSNSRDHTMRQFFEDTGGEVILASAECVTHTITIGSFQPLFFAPAFETALARLYEAALNPASETSDTTFKEFLWSYGTHFSKRSRLGARAVLLKLFPRRSTTVEEETTRRRCVLEAAGEALTPCMRRCNETTLTHFARLSVEKCKQTAGEVMALITGPLPVRSMENWSTVAEEFPDPIYHHLEPISTLIKRRWSSSDAETNKINRTILHNFFVKKLADYSSSILTGGLGRGQTSGGVPENGPVVMMGGFNGTFNGFMSSGDAIGMQRLPDLPHAVADSTLAAVGSKLYSCGGNRIQSGIYSGATASCYILDLSTEAPEWTDILEMPTAVHHHTSVTVNEHIWTIFNGKLYDLDTKSNKFTAHCLPFPVSDGHCAVSNSSHSFVFGVGSSKTEIWMNTHEYNSLSWKRVGYLRTERKHFACLWLRAQVFITGGYRSRKDTEVFDILDFSVRDGAALVHGRQGHRMFVRDGTQAEVAGGEGLSVPVFDTIETYDEKSSKWTISSNTLREPRRFFGLVQLQG